MFGHSDVSGDAADIPAEIIAHMSTIGPRPCGVLSISRAGHRGYDRATDGDGDRRNLGRDER